MNNSTFKAVLLCNSDVLPVKLKKLLSQKMNAHANKEDYVGNLFQLNDSGQQKDL